MTDPIKGAEAVSLFCRLNMNRKSGLPIRSSEMGLLIYLVRSEKPPSSLEASRFFKISKPMVTAMTRVLEKNGYIEKWPSPVDGRSFGLHPTEKARLLVEETFDEYLKSIDRLRQRLGDPDYGTLIALLERANGILLEDK